MLRHRRCSATAGRAVYLALFGLCYSGLIAAAQEHAAEAAPAPGAIDVFVKEMAGIRRFGYPVHARVPFAKGTLHDATRVRLMRGERELAAQYTRLAQWDDGSVRWLVVDWNTSPAPLESETYSLHYGDGVAPERKPHGLEVTETDEAFQVGLFRFRKDGRPLIESCTHTGSENIGPGRNGLVATDEDGRAYDLRDAEDLEVRLVKPGPVHVVLRYRGRWKRAGAEPIQFVTELGMPNSKSWWRVTHQVRDPAGRLRKIALHTPFHVGALPLVWDFGTGSWTYGALRRPDEMVAMEQTFGANSANRRWQVLLGTAGQLEPYEVGTGRRARVAEGWGHLAGKSQVVAFAMGGFARRPGSYRIAIAGDGNTEFGYASAEPRETIQLTVYQHFVSVPMQIGAATSPPAMLNPLVARCRKSYYEQCGVAVPCDAP